MTKDIVAFGEMECQDEGERSHSVVPFSTPYQVLSCTDTGMGQVSLGMGIIVINVCFLNVV
jgi:hypothetical protein